jgi:dienelactone hydrolase
MSERVLFLPCLLITAILATSSCSRDTSMPREAEVLKSTPPIAAASPASAQTAPTQLPASAATSDEQSGPTIHIEPEGTLADATANIRVVGLEPGETITVTASMRDDVGREWESYATFAADGDGIVDLATQAPITGTYSAVDGMGLLWSMVPDGRGPEQPYYANWDTRFKLVTVTGQTEAHEIGPAYHRRIRLPETIGRTILTAEEDGLVGEFFTPGGTGPFPTLIVLGGSGGGTDTAKAALLVAHGYATLALTYFGRPPLPDALADIPLEYFKTALEWLQSQPAVDDEKIGVVGTSRGGELALLLGATYPELKVVIGYVASGVTFAGYTRNRDDLRAAWTYEGVPLPYPTMEDEIEEAVIPVERISGPILLISGEDDQLWPSAELSEIAVDRLRQFNHPFEYEHLVYDDAGHFIGVPYWPTRGDVYTHPVSGVRYTAGGTPEGNAFASADSWAHVLAFLDRNLK